MSEAINYQKCPKCDGEGYVFDPNFMGTVGNKPCPVCNGAMIIPMYLPPSETFTSQERDEFAAGLLNWIGNLDNEAHHTGKVFYCDYIEGQGWEMQQYDKFGTCHYKGRITTSDLITQYKESLKLK
jgi:hypothetical protein